MQVDDSDRRPAGSRRTNRSKFAPSRSEATHCGRGIATLTTRTSRQTRSRRASRKGHVIPTFSTGRLPATYKCTFLTRQTRSQCSPCPFALGACPRFFSPSIHAVHSTPAPPGYAYRSRSTPAAPSSLLSVQGLMGRLAGPRRTSSPRP